ncbi:HAD-IC family P-type ATPase [Candidatus Microgenomates bacterium]|nr:HAD-IC family P-type ATPase [Candidatus Microgenomates bacterium]
MLPNEPGLSDEEVKKSQLKYGLNILPEKPPPSKFALLVQQLKSPLIYVLLVAALITLAIGHFSDAAIILLAVFINTILGFIQENKATKALLALKEYVTNKAIVIRSGKRMSVNTAEVVPGDLVILDQGVRICADGKLAFANRFYVDESILTGESVPVNKTRGEDVFMGTIVAAGQALMRVEAIGLATKMGIIARHLQKPEEETPLQRQLKGFSKQLVLMIGLLTVLVFILGILYKFSVTKIFITSVALAVSSIPEGLLVSLTVVLAIGMQKIVKRRGLVRRLSAAEALGGVTVICVDKTGTLTQGKMKVVEFMGDKKALAEQSLLANDLDDPIVIAAFEWGRTIIKNFVAEHLRLDSILFSSQERFFVSLHQWSDKSNMLYVNGAPELLLGWTKVSEEEKKEIMANIDALTKQGKKLIGFARKEISSAKKNLEGVAIKESLTWVGILAFSDPVRLGVKEALKLAQEAGIKTVVITGDYQKTSEFVLSALGLTVNKKEIMTGQDLGNLTVDELSHRVKSIRLFARTTPDQKLMIVEALKRNREVVAMMGDGVNDAPALYKADIGIAVGEATDVAKESSGLILLDSNFSTIVAAIEEGRAIFENIRKIILYLMSDAFVEIMVVVGSIALGLPLPITAAQILWINLVSDGFPVLALTVDPKRVNIMREKPRRLGERLFNRWMIILISLVSVVAGLIALTSFIVVYKVSGDVTVARSFTFIVLSLNSLAYVFSARTLMTPFWKNHLLENKWLVLAVLAGFSLQILPFLTPALRQFFGLESLSLIYWLVAVGLSILLFLTVEVFKLIYQQKAENHGFIRG